MVKQKKVILKCCFLIVNTQAVKKIFGTISVFRLYIFGLSQHLLTLKNPGGGLYFSKKNTSLKPGSFRVKGQIMLECIYENSKKNPKNFQTISQKFLILKISNSLHRTLRLKTLSACFFRN